MNIFNRYSKIKTLNAYSGKRGFYEQEVMEKVLLLIFWLHIVILSVMNYRFKYLNIFVKFTANFMISHAENMIYNQNDDLNGYMQVFNIWLSL